ncbi:MAG: outer membrane beta-barrel protein [Alphaproteobacteria bacterium]|nr:outer membrane beta-barrel protein [Alphaproteobacteria bacterium]
MKRSLSRSFRLSVAGFAAAAVWQAALVSPAVAQTPPPPPAAAPAAGAAAEAPAAAPAAPTSPLTAPSFAGPLAQNPTPYSFEAPVLGTVYTTGVVSGLGLFQSSPYGAVFEPNGTLLGNDISNNGDLSNGMAIVQKIDGLVQFYVQAGVYSLPALGVNYHLTQRDTGRAENDFFGYVPEAYIKVAPTDTFSVSAGKLPSLIGDEYTFTFQNMNIERGLLWNLEPAISRGVQGNLTTGPVAWAVSFNDGFYSSRYDWLSGSATWTIDPANTLALAAGGNIGTANVNTIAAPFVLNNADIVNLIYTYNAAPLTFSPYFQYTHNGHNAAITGATKDGSTWGGAVLANYAINDNFNLAGRVEYVSSSGSLTDGSANPLGFGAGSSAWSVTATPTWQNGIYFARIEGSYVGLTSIAPGSGFGRAGNTKNQERFVVEAGILF